MHLGASGNVGMGAAALDALYWSRLLMCLCWLIHKTALK